MTEIGIEDPWVKPWFDQNDPVVVNPFLQNPILQKLMSQMTIEDLKVSRSVCKEWNKYCTTELEKLTSRLRMQKFDNFDQFINFSTKFDNSENKNILLSKVRVGLNYLIGANAQFLENYQPQKIILDISFWDKYALQNTMKILEKYSNFIKSFGIMGDDLKYSQIGSFEWLENLTFPQLEEFTFKLDYYDSEHYDNLKVFYFKILQKISKKSPKLKILHLLNHPSNFELLNIFLHCGLIEKLQEFEVVYAYEDAYYVDGYQVDFTGPEDLLDMAHRGLKLKKFTGQYYIEGLEEKKILGHIQKIEEFLKIQADTLEVLKISLTFELDDDNFKLSIPKLPKLRVLELKYQHENCIPFTCTDFPKLREIIFDQTTSGVWELSQFFQEEKSLDSVETLKIRHPLGNLFKYKRDVENYFPKVRKLVLGQIKLLYTEPYIECEDIPWETTLRELTLYQIHIGNFKFQSLAHLQGLGRLVLVNKGPYLSEHRNLDLDSLAKTKITSLKLANFNISKEMIGKIREKYILDYVPPQNPNPEI